MKLVKLYFDGDRLLPMGVGRVGAAGEVRSYMCAPGVGLSGDKGWNMTPDYRRRIVICQHPEGNRSVIVPFDACIMEFDGIVEQSSEGKR